MVRSRVDELERQVRQGRKQKLTIWQHGDVYYNCGVALTERQVEELQEEFDVFIVEVMDGGGDDMEVEGE